MFRLKSLPGLRQASYSVGTKPVLGGFNSFTQRHQFHVSQKKSDEAQPVAAAAQDPKAVAEAWFNAIPGKDKAYNFLAGTTVATILLSKEILPYTVDVVYAIPFSVSIMILFKYGGAFFSDIADSVVKEEEKMWTDAKSKAEAQLTSGIQEVTGSGVMDLVEVTEGLFDHAKELATMEATAYEHEQKLAYYTKAKQILEEWVRYEGLLREREQKRIAEEVIANVMKSVKDPKFQEKYLEQCVGDIELALRK